MNSKGDAMFAIQQMSDRDFIVPRTRHSPGKLLLNFLNMSTVKI